MIIKLFDKKERIHEYEIGELKYINRIIVEETDKGCQSACITFTNGMTQIIPKFGKFDGQLDYAYLIYDFDRNQDFIDSELWLTRFTTID